MSKYLDIYLVPRNEQTEPICLTSYAASSRTYDFLTDANPGISRTVDGFADLTSDNIREALHSANEQMEGALRHANSLRTKLTHTTSLTKGETIEEMSCQIERDEAFVKRDMLPIAKELEHLLWVAASIEGNWSNSDFERLAAKISGK